MAKKAAPVAKKAAPAFSLPSFGKAPAAKPAAATKAVKKVAPKKAVAKKAAPKKAVAKKAAPKLKAPSLPKVSRRKGTGRAPPPASKSYPSFSAKASGVKFRGISGTGLFPPASGGIPQPDFSDPKLQIKRDPAFYAAAAKERAAKLASGQSLVIDDGLTDLERKQVRRVPFEEGGRRTKTMDDPGQFIRRWGATRRCAKNNPLFSVF